MWSPFTAKQYIISWGNASIYISSILMYCMCPFLSYMQWIVKLQPQVQRRRHGYTTVDATSFLLHISLDYRCIPVLITLPHTYAAATQVPVTPPCTDSLLLLAWMRCLASERDLKQIQH